MYVKPSRKQIRGVYVPENYHGTALTSKQTSQALPNGPPPRRARNPKALPRSMPRCPTRANARAQDSLPYSQGLVDCARTTFCCLP